MRTLDGVRLVLIKALVSALVLAAGFSAISDDDYARLVIAERFAHAPSLDPSGTSWLPLPFYVYGAVAAVSHGSLFAARALAFVLGLAATLIVWCAARQLGLLRTTALGGALLAALLPYSAYLGVACVPEAVTAALAVFAAAALSGSLRVRSFGALALFAACACRYEPWASAFVFSLVCVWDALRQRKPQWLLPAALAAAFPLLWLVHGAVHHGQATFFVTRVTAYRAALGPDGNLLERSTRTPLALFSGEPELMAVLLLVALPLLLLVPGRRPERKTLPRFALALCAIAALTWLGDLRGSAPTHHAERALLALWFGAALAVAAAAERVERARTLAGLAAAALLGVVVRNVRPREPFVDRRSAVAIGELARAAHAPELAVDAPDFSYFAIEAGFGLPERCRVLCEHDPRRPCEPDWYLQRDPEIRTRLGGHHQWLVLPSARLSAIEPIATVIAQNVDWALVRLHANAGAPEAPQHL